MAARRVASRAWGVVGVVVIGAAVAVGLGSLRDQGHAQTRVAGPAQGWAVEGDYYLLVQLADEREYSFEKVRKIETTRDWVTIEIVEAEEQIATLVVPRENVLFLKMWKHDEDEDR